MKKSTLVSITIFLLILNTIPFYSSITQDKIILIVYNNKFKVIGKQIYFSLQGEPTYVWESGNIVVFRVDKKIGNQFGKVQFGKAGNVYRINRNYEIERIGDFDFRKTDHSLAEHYGISTNVYIETDSFEIPKFNMVTQKEEFKEEIKSEINNAILLPDLLLSKGNFNLSKSYETNVTKLINDQRNPEKIQKTVFSYASSFYYCYERELHRSPNLKGNVTIQFCIAPNGRIKNAQIVTSTLNNERVERCILARMRISLEFTPVELNISDFWYQQNILFNQ